jgi:hypothetical protein
MVENGKGEKMKQKAKNGNGGSSYMDSNLKMTKKTMKKSFMWVKVGEKEPSHVRTFIKNYFLNFRKITMGTLYIYIYNNISYFQSCNYKIFMKIHHVSIILLYV